MRKTLLFHLIFLVQIPGYVSAQAFSNVDINNINARINCDGSQFWDFIGTSRFEVPKGSGRHSIFAGALWIGGKNSGALHFAGTRYNDDGKDFWYGPIMDSASYAGQYSSWNKVWKINKSQVDYHIANWNQPGYIMPQNFVDWPAHGNTSFGQAYFLAPFYDNNGDGNYNPSDGDYPEIKGDQAVYFILNDDSVHTQTGGNKMKIEIHTMAYAFNCPSDTALQNTLFMNYKVINRSPNNYDSTYVGIFIDGDLGDYQDDFVGCDVQRGSYYFYNGDGQDSDNGGALGYGSYIPAQSVTILAGPYQDYDNADNPLVYNFDSAFLNKGIPYSGLGMGYADNIYDNERMGLCEFRYFNNNASVTGDPSTAMQYYNYLKGLWKDGTQMVYGGNGHLASGGTVPAKYMFPGYTDPLGWGTGGISQPAWTETTSGNVPGDRKGLGSAGPFTFGPGEVAELDIAFIFGRDYQTPGPAAGVAMMQQHIDAIKEMFVNDSTPCGGKFSTVVSQISDMEDQLSLFPNPASENITVVFPSGIKNANYEICDLTGRKIAAGKIISSKQTISLKNFQCGIYFLRITDGEKIYAEKFAKN